MSIRHAIKIVLAWAISAISLGATSGIWGQQVNYERTFRCPEAEIIIPENAAEVQTIVQEAILAGRKVMAGTSDFNSQIDAACAGFGQIQVDTSKLDKVLKIDETAMLVKAQAGVRLRDLNQQLRQRKLSINMISEGGFFTIGGMLGSDTHGSTLSQGASLSEYVVSVTMVDGLGRLRAIHGEELKAIRVNLGVLGILVDATFRVEPLKKVRARIHKGSDTNIAKVLMTLPKQHYSVSLSWFPGIRKYAATSYDFVDAGTPGEAVNAQAHFPDWVIKIFKEAYQFSGQKKRRWAECGLAKIRYKLRSRSFFKENGKIMKQPVGWSDQMQYFTCNRSGTCPWDIVPIVVGGFSLPMSKLEAWVADVRSIVDTHSQSRSRACFPLNGIYFRFGQGTDAWLALNEGQDTVFIDIEYVVNTKGMDDDGTLKTVTREPQNIDVVREIEQMSLQKYSARPHWGKNQASHFWGVGSRQYPAWDSFLAYKKQVDPNNTFTNPWWERIVSPRTEVDSYYPNCALDGTCICSDDSHCPSGRVCRFGKVWKKARICQLP